MPAYRGRAKWENTSLRSDENVSTYSFSLSHVLTAADGIRVIPDLDSFFARATLCFWRFEEPSQAAR